MADRVDTRGVVSSESRSRLRIGTLAPRLVAAGLDHPYVVAAFWLVFWLLCLVGLCMVRVETSGDSVMDRAHEAYRFHRDSQSIFGGDEMLAIAVEARAPFDPDALREVVRISEELELLPEIRRVDSIATVAVVQSSPEGALRLDAPLEDGVPSTREKRAELARVVLGDRIAPRHLVSEDGRTFAVNALLKPNVEVDHVDLVRRVRAIAGPGRAVTGVPVYRAGTHARTIEELIRLTPLAVGGVVLVLGVFLRSFVGSAIPLLSGLIGTLGMLGFMGASGRPFTLFSMVLPGVLIALGGAYGMHFVAAAQSRPRESLPDVFATLAWPVSLSGLTTAVGFCGAALTRIDMVRGLGLCGAVGVTVTVLFVLTAVPTLLLHWPPRVRPAIVRAPTPLAAARRIVELCAGSGAALRWLWVAGALLLGVGLARLDVLTDVITWFPPGSLERDDYERVRAPLSGISPINVVIDPGDRRVTDPAILTAIDGLAAHLEHLPQVGRLGTGDDAASPRRLPDENPCRPLADRH